MREEFEKLAAAGKIQSRQIDALVELTKFGYCTHRSWGFGKITKLDTIDSRFLIDFEDKPAHSMDLGFGANTLNPIHPDHILVRKRQDLPGVKTMAMRNHVELIRLVLKSYGGSATIAQIQKVLVPDVIAADWRKWWDGVRAELKKDGHFQLPFRKTDPIVYTTDSVSIDDRLLTEFRRARGLKARIPIVTEMAKNHEDFVDKQKTFATVVELLNAEIDRLRERNTTLALDGMFIRDDLLRRAKLGTPNVEEQADSIWQPIAEQKARIYWRQLEKTRQSEREEYRHRLEEQQQRIDDLPAKIKELREDGETEQAAKSEKDLARRRKRLPEIEKHLRHTQETTERFAVLSKAVQEAGRLRWELSEDQLPDKTLIDNKLRKTRKSIVRWQKTVEEARKNDTHAELVKAESKLSQFQQEMERLAKISASLLTLKEARNKANELARQEHDRVADQFTKTDKQIAELQKRLETAQAKKQTADIKELEQSLRHAQKNHDELDRIVKTLKTVAETKEQTRLIRQELKSAQKTKDGAAIDKVVEKIMALHPSENARVAKILEQLPAVRHKKALKSFKDSRGEDWVIAFLGVINRVNARLVGESVELLAEFEQLDLLKRAIAQAISQHQASSELLLWLTKHRLDFFADILDSEVFRSMIAALERDQLEEKKTNRLNDHIMNEMDLLPRLISSADMEVVKELTRTLQLTSCFDDMDKRSLLARIVKVYPHIQTLITGEADAQSKGLVVSWASLERRRNEYDELVHKKIPANSREIAVARSYGDLRENHEFKAAKEMQKLLMTRKAEMEAELLNAQGTDFSESDPSRACAGTVVEVTDLSQNARETFTILGAWDSDPDLGLISYLTPLAQKLLNREAGDEIELEHLEGKRYRIDSIRKIPQELAARLNGETSEASAAEPEALSQASP